MTPVEYAKVKDVFARAILTPDEDRVAFVKQQCGDDTQVATEVFSLLRHHAENTIIATDGVESATTVFVNDSLYPGQNSAKSLGDSVVIDPPNEADPYLVLNDIWNDNRQILRRRLIIIACVLTALIAISSLRLFTYDYLPWGYGVRAIAIATCGLTAWVLHRNPDLSLKRIRIAECLIMASVGLLVIVIDVRPIAGRGGRQ